MLDYALSKELLSLAELSHLRTEAMRLFEDCLTNNDDTALVAFIEHQIMQDPPPINLLRDIADDLQQRMLSLREHHFDTRDRVVSTLSEGYNIDITPLTPPAKLAQYHALKINDVMHYIQQQATDLYSDELAILRKLITASLETAGQLHQDIQMTTQLHSMVLDWMEGISSLTVRENWPNREAAHFGHSNNIQH